MRSAIVKNTLNFGSARCLNRYLAAVPAMSLIPFAPYALPAENFSEDQWRNNCRVGFDDEPRRRGPKFAPGDFFIRHRTGVRSVARGGIADLAEVAPFRHDLADDVLVEHRHDANRKVAGDAATDLEKADRGTFALASVPFRQLDHVFNARARGMRFRDLAGDDARGIYVAERRIFPAGNENRQIFLRRRHHPTV